jgi:hypothetical protein
MMTLAAITFTAFFQRRTKPIQTLSNDARRNTAPGGIFASYAHEGVSSRYALISTTEVIDTTTEISSWLPAINHHR